MGVLACFRKGCQNIMCDRYSSTYGYICHECFEELIEAYKERGRGVNITIDGFIAQFMESKKLIVTTKEKENIIEILSKEFSILQE